jgi:hypothetical protein
MKNFVVFLLLTLIVQVSFASDHDDGETDSKGRNLSLTDLYVFREDWQSGNASHSANLIFIMNLNPRSLPGQEYFFSTNARYEFHMSALSSGAKTVRPTGQNDVTLRFEFGAPLSNGTQQVTMTVVRDGVVSNPSGSIFTTSAVNSKSDVITNNNLLLDGKTMTVFAGLREDPFFFDVEQFFKVRAAAVASQGFIGFLPPSSAKDFTHNYNVLSIVARVPISILQNNDTSKTIFDVWQTISVPM